MHASSDSGVIVWPARDSSPDFAHIQPSSVHISIYLIILANSTVQKQTIGEVCFTDALLMRRQPTNYGFIWAPLLSKSLNFLSLGHPGVFVTAELRLALGLVRAGSSD